MNLSRPRLFLGGRLLIAASTLDLFIGLFRVLASSWFRLGGSKCPGIYQFLPNLLVYVYRDVSNNI